MFDKRCRAGVERSLRPVGSGLAKAKISADQLTVLGGDAVEGAVAEPDRAVDAALVGRRSGQEQHDARGEHHWSDRAAGA